MHVKIKQGIMAKATNCLFNDENPFWGVNNLLTTILIYNKEEYMPETFSGSIYIKKSLKNVIVTNYLFKQQLFHVVTENLFRQINVLLRLLQYQNMSQIFLFLCLFSG